MCTHLLSSAVSGILSYSTEIILIWLGILTIGLIVAIYCFTKRHHPLSTGKDTPASTSHQNTDEALLRNQITVEALEQSKVTLSLTLNAIKEALEKSTESNEVTTRLNNAYKYATELQRSFVILSETNNDNNYAKELNVREYNIFDVSDYILNSFAGIMQRRKINLSKKQTSQKGIYTWIDNQKFEFALYNIFGEALRNIDHDGDLFFDIESQMNHCVISIEFRAQHPFSDSVFNLSNRIILLHHGTFSVTQGNDGKRVLRVSIPLGETHFKNDTNVRFAVTTAEPAGESPAEAVKESVAMVVNAPNTKSRILVVEDHKDIRAYIKAILSPTYEILFAENGQDGIDMAKEESPDLVLCDIMMPVKDGFECCREIKEDVSTCHIPVIMLTAKEEDEDVIKGTLMGADDYIIKPFNTEILKAKISNLIRTRQALRHAYMKLLDISDTEDAVETETDSNNNTEEQNFINTILNTIEEHIQEPDFSAKKLAEIVGMSQSTLYRRIKQNSDFTIIELIRGVRLKRAATLLAQQQYNVQEVVEIVGYNDIPTFRKHFVDLFGMTPSAYASVNSNKAK